MSSLDARRASGIRAATTPTTRSRATPAVKSAETRRARKNTRRKAAKARKQERKQEALSRQGEAQHREQQAGKEKQQRERGSAAARVIQTAFRARYLSRRSTERPQRAQVAQPISEACPTSIKRRDEAKEGDGGLGRGDPVSMAEPPAEDGRRAKDRNIVIAEERVPPVTTATIPLPAAVAHDGEGRASTARQKKNVKKKEARVRKTERQLVISAVQDRVRRESAAAAAGTIQAAWRRSRVRAQRLWVYPLRAGERRRWAARVISKFLQLVPSGRVEPAGARRVAPGAKIAQLASGLQTAGGTGPEIELGAAGELPCKSRQGAATAAAEPGEEALVSAASCQQGVHAAVDPDDSDDRAVTAEAGVGPPQAPVSSNPSPLTSRVAATDSSEEKRLNYRTKQDEELKAEASGRAKAAARRDAQALAAETTETLDSWSEERQAARVIAGACRAYAKAKRVAGVAERHPSRLEESAPAAAEPRAEEARTPEGAHKLATEENARDDDGEAPVEADNMAVSSAVEADGDVAEVTAAAEATVERTATAKLEQPTGNLEAKKAEREDLENLLLAKVLQALKEKQAKVGMDVPAVEATERPSTKATQSATSDHLPPAPRQAEAPAAESPSSSPKHTKGSPRSSSSGRRYVTHPLQVVEGRTLLYDPDDFDLWELMTQVRGWSLALGAAPVWGGGNGREAEAFSAVCGFSAAWGSAVLKQVTVAVYGRVFAGGVSVLSADHVVYAFGRYWDREVAPCDPEERFFRLVRAGGNGSNASGTNGGLRKEELRPFVHAIASRHPDLEHLSPDECALYTDTALVILFYRFSRSGVITLAELRSSGFVRQMNAVGRLEMDLEESPFFSLWRQNAMRSEYLSLCGQSGWGVGQESLRRYRCRHDGFGTLGAARASRIIYAEGRRSAFGPPSSSSSPSSSSPASAPSSRSSSFSSSSSTSWSSSWTSASPASSSATAAAAARAAARAAVPSAGGGCGRQLDYDAWIRFWLCEQALRSGGASCSSRDVRYCFRQLDEAGRGRVGLRELVSFYEEARLERAASEGQGSGFPDIQAAFSQFRDSIGADGALDFITLEDVTKPANIERSGRFFASLFLGVDFDGEAPVGGVCIAARCCPTELGSSNPAPFEPPHPPQALLSSSTPLVPWFSALPPTPAPLAPSSARLSPPWAAPMHHRLELQHAGGYRFEPWATEARGQ